MQNKTDKNKWIVIVYANDEKISSRHFNDEYRTYDEAEALASKWIEEKFKNYDWVLHSVYENSQQRNP